MRVTPVQARGPFLERFFQNNSDSMKISFCSQPRCSEVIAMKFRTWHGSCAVVPCAKFCSHMIPYNGMTLKLICHRICIMMEKSFVKWAPGQHEFCGQVAYRATQFSKILLNPDSCAVFFAHWTLFSSIFSDWKYIFIWTHSFSPPKLSI